MKKLFTILSFSLFSVTLNADYSGFLFNGGTANDYGYDIKQTADGGVIIVGTTSSYGAGGKDVYIIKKDIHNDTTWTKTFGGTGDEEGYSVVQTPDGKYAITGYTTSYGRGEEDLLFLKLNSNGSLDYYQTYGGTASEIGRKIILMPDSGFTMVGYTKSYGAGGKDIYIVQLDKSGNTIWSDYYGTTANDEAYSMLQNDDGNLIIAACTEYNAASYKSIYLLNIKPTGSSNWAKIISSSLNETPLAIAETYDRNYLITGKSVAPSSSNDNILLAKFDTLGNLIFKNNYGGKRSDIGNAIIPYFDMGYYVVGTSRSYNNDSIPEIYLMQVDEWGDSIQATTFSHDYEDYASAAILTTDSNIIIVGSSGNGDRAIDIAQLPTSLNCVGYYPRSILVGPLWAPANDSLLNPGTPIEPFPAIMHSEYQKLRFANYLLHGHFHEIIIAVDSLFEEDEGSGNDHNSAVNGVVLRDSLSALILRLKTYYKVTKVIAWIQHTRDEKTAMDTTNNMDIVRRLVKFNTDTAHHGKFDGMYDDYEFWEKRYGWSNGNTTDPDFGNIDTGYVRFKQLLNAMLTVRTNPSNKLPFLYIYLADLYRSGDSLHPNVLDYKVLNYVDSIANYANTNLFGSYAVKTPYVNISLQFYITDLTDSGNCGQGKWPTRFIDKSNYLSFGKRIELLGQNVWPTYLYIQFSAEDKIGTSPGKNNNYLGDWYQGGNYDVNDCFINQPHYFYQADSILRGQMKHFNDSLPGIFGSTQVRGFQIFKFDKISIDTLRARDSILLFNSFCSAFNNRLSDYSNTLIDNIIEAGEDIFINPNPFNSNALLKIETKELLSNKHFKIYNLFGQELSQQIKIKYKNKVDNIVEFEIVNNGLPNGLYILVVRINNESHSLKFIIKQ